MTLRLALRPASSWVLLNRGQLGWSRLGAWERGLADLEQRASQSRRPRPRICSHSSWDGSQNGWAIIQAALEHYRVVIAADAASDLARHARLNRARVELELGPAGRARAWADYERLVAEDPTDPVATARPCPGRAQDRPARSRRSRFDVAC